jgi:hypothetical protein
VPFKLEGHFSRAFVKRLEIATPAVEFLVVAVVH